MNDTILMLILLGVLVIAILYLIWEINFCLNTVIYTRQKKKMFKSLENILLSYYNKNDVGVKTINKFNPIPYSTLKNSYFVAYRRGLGNI